MVSDLSALLVKTEDDLRKYAQATTGDGLNSLFGRMWEAIRGEHLFAGQARNERSSEALSFPRVAMTLAEHANSANLRAEAHRMMAYVLNANELYQDAILHYMQAIMLLENEKSFQMAARTRLGLIAALFMTGHYQEAIQEGDRAASWFKKSGDRDGLARLSANLGNLYQR